MQHNGGYRVMRDLRIYLEDNRRLDRVLVRGCGCVAAFGEAPAADERGLRLVRTQPVASVDDSASIWAPSVTDGPSHVGSVGADENCSGNSIVGPQGRTAGGEGVRGGGVGDKAISLVASLLDPSHSLRLQTNQIMNTSNEKPTHPFLGFRRRARL